ncbi:MAG: hypothetical protein K6G83_11390 [Lachnospiraceae bacterium]|nr:hypothetical protein [Lachnospiraceae bacterium]
MKNKQTGIKKRIWQGAAVVLTVALVAAFFMTDAFAVFSEKSAMKYKQYASEHEVEDSVMFIGTYLIHINAMTDALYQQATQSGSDANQNAVYYKSELAGGAWFDITNAEGLDDIMDSAEAVSEDEIGDLFVQYYVDAQGNMTNVMTGDSVNPFDIPDPYDLKKLPELQNLWIQYAGSADAEEISEDDYLKKKNSQNAGTIRGDVYCYQLLTTFFGLDLSDEETDQYDADLARLFACYQSMKSSGQDEEADIIYSLMKKVDDARRAVVMTKLSGGEVNALGVLYDLVNGAYYTTFGNFKDSSSDDTEGNDATTGRDTSQDPEYITELKDAVSHEFENEKSLFGRLTGGGDSSDNEWWGPLQNNYNTYADKYEETEDGEPADDGVPRPAYSPDNSLLDSVSDCAQGCQTSYNNYQADALSDSDTILGHAEYEYSNQVIEEASSDGAGGPITLLRDIMNIEQGTIKHSDSEKALLDNSLLNLGESKYQSAVSEGAGSAYTNALSMGAGGASADNALDEQYAEVESARSELEYLIDAYKQREEAAKAHTYIQGAISWTNGLYGSVPGDAFSSRATGSVDNHMKWLKDLDKQVKASDESLKSKLDELSDKKAELQRKRDEALDKNDLAGAKEYDAKIAAVDQDIAEEEAKTGQKAGDQLADDILSDTLSKIADDPEADISDALASLAGMGAVDALSKIKDRAANAGAPESTLNGINDALTDGVNTMAGGNGSTSDSVGAAAVNALNDLKDKAGDAAAYGEMMDALDYAIGTVDAADASSEDVVNAIAAVKDQAEQSGASDDVKNEINKAMDVANAGGTAADAASALDAIRKKATENGAENAPAALLKAIDDAKEKVQPKDALSKTLNAVGTVKDRAEKAGASDGLKKDIDKTLNNAASGASGSETKAALEAIKNKAAAEGSGGGVSPALAAAIDNALNDMKQKAAAENVAAVNPTAGLNEAGIIKQIEATMGASIEELSESDLATTAAAVSRFARSGNQSAGVLSGKLADYMRQKGNKYLYSQFREKTPQYVSLNTIGLVTDYRYLYDDRKNTATMSKGASAWSFQVGTNTLIRNGGDAETLKEKAVKGNDPYISVDDAKNYFDVIGEYLYGTDYAVCLTEPMDTKAGELLSALTGEKTS